MTALKKETRFVVSMVRYDGTDDVSIKKIEGCQVHFKVKYASTSLRTRRKLIKGGCCLIQETFCFGNLSLDEPRLTLQMRKNTIMHKSTRMGTCNIDISATLNGQIIEEKMDLTPIGVGSITVLIELATADRIANVPDVESIGSSDTDSDPGRPPSQAPPSKQQRSQHQHPTSSSSQGSMLTSSMHDFKAIDDKGFRNQNEQVIQEYNKKIEEGKRQQLESLEGKKKKKKVETVATACGSDMPMSSHNTVGCQTLIVRGGMDELTNSLGEKLDFDDWGARSGTKVNRNRASPTQQQRRQQQTTTAPVRDYAGELRTAPGIQSPSHPSPIVDNVAAQGSATMHPDYTISYFPPAMRDRPLPTMLPDAEAMKRTVIAYPSDDFEGMATYCERLRHEKDAIEKRLIEAHVLLTKERARHLAELGATPSNDEGYSDLDSLYGGGSLVAPSTVLGRRSSPSRQMHPEPSSQADHTSELGGSTDRPMVPTWVQSVIRHRGPAMSQEDYRHLMGEYDCI